MAIDVTQSHLLECQQYKAAADGTIVHYVLVVTPKSGDEAEEILIKPSELASSKSLKRVLLDRKILYIASKKEHDANIAELTAGNLVAT